MTPMLWTWLLSLTGAGLFFAAGAALTGRRVAGVAGPQLNALAAPAAPFELLEPVTASLERELANGVEQRAQLRQQLDSERERVRTVEVAHQRLEVTAHAAQLELEATRAKLLELSQRAAPDARTAALQHELALCQEAVRARDLQLDQIREETTRLRQVEAELGRTEIELDQQREEARVLRSQAFASRPPQSRRPSSEAPISAHIRALQSIVDAETRMGRAKSAVIADELGLLVAASGATNEYGDALAAMGAYLADVGIKTRDMLPLHQVSQVVIRDDHDVTLTVRPLAADDPGLALVTLAVGPNTGLSTEPRHH
jgi:predicted regulator of Ras-like GTPase activity (Roadblock/LC7/MglB family)